MTTNISESLNLWLKEAQELLVIGLERNSEMGVVLRKRYKQLNNNTRDVKQTLCNRLG